MPMAAPIIAAAAAAGFSAAAGVTIFGLSVALSSAVIFAATLALGFVQQMLAPKPKTPSIPDFSFDAGSRTQTVRQAITERDIVVGRVKKSGPMTFYESTQSKAKHHMVIPIADHPCRKLGTVYLGDEPVFDRQIGADGMVTDGRFANKVRIKKHLGDANQFADSYLISQVTYLDDNFRGRGVTYIYVELDWDDDTFPNGLPNIAVLTDGLMIDDPRGSGIARWTPNAALAVRWYVADSKYGLDGLAELDDAYFISAANTSDEIVPTKVETVEVTDVDVANNLIQIGPARADDNDKGYICPFQIGDQVYLTSTLGSPDSIPSPLVAHEKYYLVPVEEQGNVKIRLATSYENALDEVTVTITSAGEGTISLSKCGEPRYTANGVIQSSQQPNDILDQMLRACAGRLVDAGGRWRLHVAAWQEPEIVLDESDLRGPIKIQTKHSRRERFNAVKGVYSSPINQWVGTDYPPITSDTYKTQDREKQLWKDLDQPFITRAAHTTRCGSIELNRHRRQKTVYLQCMLTAFEIQVGDTFALSMERWAFVEKTFECVEWSLVIEMDDKNNVPIVGVDIVGREIDADVFAFDAETQQILVDPQPATNGPRPFDVDPPTAILLYSGTDELYTKLDGTIVSRIRATWTASPDAWVRNYEVQHKKSADVSWQPSQFLGRDETTVYIWDAEDSQQYQVRVRAVNRLGARSTWLTSSLHTVIGKTAPPSDVTTLSVAQNGNSVNIYVGAVADADLDLIEIRYAAQGSTDWGAALVLANILRGESITSASANPGTWTFMAKARDTSGNYSLNAITYDFTVTNANTTILNSGPDEAPDWLGEVQHFYRHHTGVLIPTDKNLASSYGFELFDTMVPTPQDECIYTAREVDAGFDGTFRLFGAVVATTGPGHTGEPDPALQIDWRLAAGTYDGFEAWTIGSITARYAKERFVLQPNIDACAYISSFIPTYDAETREIEYTGETIAPGGTTFTFADRFFNAPNVQVTGHGTTALIGQQSATTATSTTAHLFNAAGTDVGGTADIRIRGV